MVSATAGFRPQGTQWLDFASSVTALRPRLSGTPFGSFRFTLSFRDVEELLAQRGIGVSYETVRCWTIKFGPQIAAKLRRRRAPPSPRWHLDEMVCNIGGERVYLWRGLSV